jgi:hypothetical protein
VLLASHPGLEVAWTHRRAAREYSLSTGDLRAALDGAGLASPEGLALTRTAIRQGEAQLRAAEAADTDGENLR